MLSKEMLSESLSFTGKQLACFAQDPEEETSLSTKPPNAYGGGPNLEQEDNNEDLFEGESYTDGF